MDNDDDHNDGHHHFGITDNFTHEDFQHVLGAMMDDANQHHHQQQREQQTDGQPNQDCLKEAESVRSKEPGSDKSLSDDGVVDDDEGKEIPEESKVQARSERKRSREKQRRSDVKKQFEDLAAVIKQIESSSGNNGGEPQVQLSFSPTNRVDLIARSVHHLRCLYQEKKKKDEEIESLKRQLEQAKKAGEDTAAKLKEVMFNQPGPSKQVMMMVPMIMPHGPTNGQTGTAMPMMNPFMAPQGFSAAIPSPPPNPTTTTTQHQSMYNIPTPNTAAPVPQAAVPPTNVARNPTTASSTTTTIQPPVTQPSQQQQPNFSFPYQMMMPTTQMQQMFMMPPNASMAPNTQLAPMVAAPQPFAFHPQHQTQMSNTHTAHQHSQSPHVAIAPGPSVASIPNPPGAPSPTSSQGSGSSNKSRIQSDVSGSNLAHCA